MKQLRKRHSYTYLDPRVPGIVQAVGACQDDHVFRREESGHHEDDKTASGDTLGHLRRDLHIDEHLVKLKDLYKRLGTNPHSGLSEQQVKANLEKYGENVFEPPDHAPGWLILLQHMFGGFSSLLLLGAGLCFWSSWMQHYFLEDLTFEYFYVGVVLMFVVVVSGLCTYYQELKRDVIIESFQKVICQYALVVRDGALQEVDIRELVVGDIVQIKYGDKVPADLRMITCVNLKVDNSILTGDSEPQPRYTDKTHENPLDSKNLCFYATNVVKGCGKGVVVNVGQRTLLGRIAGAASEMETNDTPIAVEVEDFVKIISSVAVVIGLVFFTLSIVLGNSCLDSSIFLIGLIVANIPEGLLATVTICLALTAKKMSDKNCVAKHLEAVETLGFVDCLCFDKTGVVTKNEVTVSHVWYSGTTQSFETDGDISLRWLRYVTTCPNDEGFVTIANAAVLSSRPRFRKRNEFLQSFARTTATDLSTEEGILESFKAFVRELDMVVTKFSQVCEMSFNSLSKFHASVHEIPQDDSTYLLILKGAPEAILDRCSTILVDNKEIPLDQKWKKQVEENIRAFGDMGERVVGFCDARLPSEYNGNYKFDPENPDFLNERNFRFVGLISLRDPIRCSVPDAIAKCRSAGIKLIMITADHPVMAKRIATECGIISSDGQKRLDEPFYIPEEPTKIIHGEELQRMEGHELDKLLRENDNVIFARTCPQQKLEIVEACERQGWITAVTGQAVNDSPALRKADVGVALGIQGSDVAKDAADVIIVDDNFSSIVTGIEEGRIIFDNLKKCIAYLLTDNMAELTHFFLFLLTRIPLPLGTISILCLDLGTDIIPSVSLVYEKGESEVMKRPPRNINDKLVTRQLLSYAYGQIGIIESVAAIFSYTIVMAENGFLPQTLFGIREKWNSEAINDLQDSYGQEWSYEQRKHLEMTCSTAYFVAIVVTQWSNLLVCKTAGTSLHKSLRRNTIMSFALIFETLVAAFLVYTPGVAHILNLRPLRLLWWLVPLPFAGLILIYDETRRYLVRKYPNTWISQEFQY